MGGREEPPPGTPEGGSGGDDDVRPVVFDESFIRAARIQELSAQERMSAGNPPTRRRGTRGGTGGGLPRQALALMLLVSLAFAAAVYMGSKHPYIDSTGTPTQLSMMVVPLQPGAGGIPTGTRFGNATATATATATTTATATATASGSASGPGSPSPSASASPSPGPGPFAGTAVEDYAIGGAGILLPFPHHTADFSSDQVLRALKIVYNYLYASSLDSTVLTGAGTSSVKQVLAPAQYKQFEDSLNNPRDDQQHDVTGWLVRFDPSKVRLVAADGIRVRGDLEYKQLDPGTLEVTSDYTFVYALTRAPAASASPSPSASPTLSPSPAATAHGSASPVSPVTATATAAAQPPIVLFTVRRAITYRFTADDLNAEQVELVDSVVQAGPMSCDADTSSYLQPLFPAAATTPAADRHPAASGSSTPQAAPGPGPSVDPFNHTRPAWDVCGVLTGPTLQHEPPLPSQAGTG